jgi:hypothetical protein
MSYPTAYEDLELALANGQAVIELGEVQLGENGDEMTSDRWVEAQGDIYPGDTAPGTTPEGFGWPQAVPIRPGRWDLETSSYRVATGDTIAGLSATYLGTPQRLMEIWLLQPAEKRAGRSADTLYPEEWLLMPADAVATLRAAVGLPPVEGGGVAAPAPAGGYVVTGTAPPGSSVAQAQTKAKQSKYLLYGAIGAGALGLLWALS